MAGLPREQSPLGQESGDVISPSSSVSLPRYCRPFLHVVAARSWALQTQVTTRRPSLRGADEVAHSEERPPYLAPHPNSGPSVWTLLCRAGRDETAQLASQRLNPGSIPPAALSSQQAPSVISARDEIL